MTRYEVEDFAQHADYVGALDHKWDTFARRLYLPLAGPALPLDTFAWGEARSNGVGSMKLNPPAVKSFDFQYD